MMRWVRSTATAVGILVLAAAPLAAGYYGCRSIAVESAKAGKPERCWEPPWR